MKKKRKQKQENKKFSKDVYEDIKEVTNTPTSEFSKTPPWSK